MASFNKITIVGYLGRDPEIRYTPQGTAVCTINVATTEKRKGNGGQEIQITTWFRIALWGRLAENANKYLKKGKRVYIEGRLRLEKYVDRENIERQSLEVTATEMQFMDDKDRSSGGNSDLPSVPEMRAGVDTDSQDDDQIPF